MASSPVPLVSVVVPVWRPKRAYLEECLSSILAQQDVALELIVSDNDPSHGVAREVVEVFGSPSIRYEEYTVRQGIFPNLNHAFRHARGEFIQIFCQDDRMLPCMLKTHMEGLLLHPEAGFIYGQCHFIDEAGRRTRECPYLDANRPFRYFSPEQARANFFKYGCLPGNLSAVMMRRSLYEMVGPFDEQFSYAGDFRFWVASTHHGGMAVSTTPTFELRRHGRQASRMLGTHRWLGEAAPVYSELYELLPWHLKGWRTRLYACEHFGQQVALSLMREALSQGQPHLLKHLGMLHCAPFNLFAIGFMTLLSVGGRIEWFRLPEIDFFAESDQVSQQTLTPVSER